MKKTYIIKVKQLSALHINGGTAADKKRITVKYDGKGYIPATLFKGVFRSYFSMLLNTFNINQNECDRLFGKEGFQKSRVILDNLLTEQKTIIQPRTNVGISRYTRKSLDGMLVTSETISPFDKEGKPIVYSGEMTVYYDDENIKYENLILAALESIKAIGSGKSRGLGFVEVTAAENQWGGGSI